MSATTPPPAPDSTGRISRLLQQARTAAEQSTIGLLIVTGGLSVGGFFADQAWPCELMCHFRLQEVVAAACCVVALAGLRRWRWGRAAGLLAVLNGWTLWPYYPFPETPRALSKNPLRVVSANLYSGNPTPDALIEYVRRVQPDVLVALEVTPDWERRLTELHAEFPYRAVQSRSGNFGIALYSRLPIREQSFAPLSEHNSAIVARLDTHGDPLTVIAAHPYPPGGGRNTRLRNTQLSELGRLAAAAEGSCLVAGDLNVTPFSPAFDRLLSSGQLRDPRLNRGFLPTWPAGRRMLQIPIDHCLARGAHVELTIGPDVGSDHFPVLAHVWMD